MIVGIGIDLQEVQKIGAEIEREAYLRRIFTPGEIEYCRLQAKPAECFAGKFAAKEAFMKALDSGIRQAAAFSDIEVIHSPAGAPRLRLKGKAEIQAQERAVDKIHVSISHSGGFATAVVILENSCA